MACVYCNRELPANEGIVINGNGEQVCDDTCENDYKLHCDARINATVKIVEDWLSGTFKMV